MFPAHHKKAFNFEDSTLDGVAQKSLSIGFYKYLNPMDSLTYLIVIFLSPIATKKPAFAFIPMYITIKIDK